MASGWFASKAIELIRARSLFVNVSPAPTSLSERRAVLHALGRHGQIEVFKRLPSPETFICAPARAEHAKELVKHSPITFRFLSETPESVDEESRPGLRGVGVASPIQVHIERNRRGASATQAAAAGAAAAAAERSQEPSDIVKTFTMRINPSQSYYGHKTNIRLSPTHGPWAATAGTRSEDRDFVYLALRDVVPRGIAREGLCDWHTGAQLSGEPVSMRAQSADAKLLHIMERQARRRARDELARPGRRGLAAITSVDALLRGAGEAGGHEPPQAVAEGPGAESAREAAPPAPPPPRQPAWVRRKQFKLNPLADGGAHSKVIKKEGIQGKRFDWKPLFNSQADRVRLPRP